jgi:hypothetical protein
LIERSTKPNTLEAKQVTSTNALDTTYASLSWLTVKGQDHLLGYNPTSDWLDVYQFSGRAPWVKKAAARPKVGSGFDIIEPFVIGNQPHLMCYTAKNGIFALLALDDELSATKPYQFIRYHEPGLTQGFTTIKPFNCFGQVVFLGYNGENGHVSMYTLAVTATSHAETPPLRMNPVWSHQWAKGWTRFAFFQLGGETFFLKTNTWKPNVNIDHVLDNLSGTVQVGTNLDLKNAQQLEIVQSFNMEDGDPYFVTYEKSGEVTLNRINGNCLGWITESSFKAKENATQVVPIEANRSVLLLVT